MLFTVKNCKIRHRTWPKSGVRMKGSLTILLASAVLAAMSTVARAGYTHYFIWTKPPDAARLKACLADMGKILTAANELVAGPDGDGAAMVGPLKLEFNGRGDNSHEPFVFPGTVGFNFCKTQWKPYDAVVTACLIAARDHFPPADLAIASDGDWSEGDWSAGARLYERALGRTAADPLSGFDDPQSLPGLPGQRRQPNDVTWLNRIILISLAAGVLWWLTRPHYAFSIFVAGSKIDRVRGRAPRPFLIEVDDICREFNIPRGRVRALQLGRWIRLLFSREIPADCRQRIRNVWAGYL